ncbi:MAG: hypothetical protein R2836_01310 [Chitinophagales bacterium]
MKFFTLFFICFGQLLLAQNSLVIGSYNATDNVMWQLYNYTTDVYAKNEKSLHEITDLVNVNLIDSVFKRKFERHRVFGGGIIHLLGFKWRAYETKRQKFVGWVNHQYLHGVDAKHHFTEYDINYDLIPILPKYQVYVYGMYQKQLSYKRNKKRKDTANEPYVFPKNESDLTKYRLHCENTPPEEFRSMLSTLSYPIHRINPTDIHYNFEQKHPVVGMYGVMCLDCNHSCHPEMHPYECFWWLNTTEESAFWNINLVRETSNRFKHWTTSPRTGKISIPFIFNIENDDLVIEIDHKVFSNFDEEAFKKLSEQYKSYFFDELLTEFKIELPNKVLKNIAVKSNVKVPYKALSFYFSNINFDEQNNLLSGYFNLLVSVKETYAASVKWY